MENTEEKTQILVKLARVEEQVELGFRNVNRRLDISNGRIAKAEDKLDNLERSTYTKKIDFKLIIIGIVIGAFVVAAGGKLQDILKLTV